MKKKSKDCPDKNRRDFLRVAGVAAVGVPVLLGQTSGGRPFTDLLKHFLLTAQNSGRADAQTQESYFLHIFLLGAADGFLAVDPVIGDKASSSSFDDTHKSAPYASTAVPGKNNLVVGLGLKPAVSAFAAMPTAFVRGLFIEVTAHPIARRYNYSGRPSLSESRSYPCIGQLMANVAGGFPAHVILGTPAPILDTTTNVAPKAPMQSSSAEALHSVLDRPGRTVGNDGKVSFSLSDDSFATTETLLTQLDNSHNASLSQQGQDSLKDWFDSQRITPPLYAKNLGSQIVPSAEMLERYGSTKNGDFGDLIAGASKTLQAGVCANVTISIANFDTHSNHFALHVPRLQSFATALAALVQDLKAAPAKNGGTMADKTTILISTDFGRTPALNAAEGTDHFQSGWAIVMGNGVKDNSVVGRTDANGEALGWKDGAPVARSPQTALLPDHLIATILRKLGYADAAKAVSEVNLNDLVA